MAWIEIVDEKEAEGKLKELYDEVQEKRGKISNIWRVHSLHPKAMEHHMELYMALMFKQSELSREERELIAVAVSKANGCEYCTHHHAEALNHYWKNDSKIQQLITDSNELDMSERQQHLLRYVVKLTKYPSDVNESDVKRLKDFGFSDKDILDMNLIACYFNFVNRIALGLGVSFTESETKGYNY